MKRWNRGIIGVLVCVVFVAWAAGYRWVNQPGSANPPRIGVSLRSATLEGDRVTAEWHVENCWDQDMTFEENNIARVLLNNEPVPNPTEAVVLAPGESRTIQIEVSGARETLSNELTVSAECEEGSCIGMSLTVNHGEVGEIGGVTATIPKTGSE